MSAIGSRPGWRRTFATWMLACAAQFAAPVGEARRLDQLTLEHWDTADGLPHNTVQAVTQTRDGYLWFGTWEGLVRFNGRDMRVFDRVNTPALGDNGIRALHAARDGALWVGTARSGALRHHQGQWRRYTRADGLGSDQVPAITEDGEGRIVLGSYSGVLARLEPDGTLTRFDLGESNATLSLARDAEGTVWIGTQLGLMRLTENRVEAYADDALDRQPVSAIGFVPGRGLIVAQGRALWRRGDTGFERLEVEALTSDVERIVGDRAGRLLVGTLGDGLLRVGEAGAEQLDTSLGLPNNRVGALFVDREDSLWVGTNGGLARLREAAFAAYSTLKGLSDNYVRAVLEARDGAVWIGTSQGLNRWRDGRVERIFRQRQGLASDGVLSLMQDHDGAIWVGSYDSGITVLRGGAAVRRIGVTDGLPSGQIRSLLQTADGRIWVGTPRGLAWIRDATIEVVRDADRSGRIYVLSLFEDRAGKLWVGTDDGVLVVQDGGLERWLGGNIASQDVFGFHEDERGVLWIAADDGLYRVQGDRAERIGEAEGVPHVPLFSVVEDARQQFWLTSNRGAFRVPRERLDAIAAGGIDNVEFDVFREAEGLASSQFSGASSPAVWRTRAGPIWFATAKGAALVDPAQFGDSRRPPPPVVIEEVLVDGRPVTPEDTLDLAPGTRKLEIRYAGLSFVTPGELRYRVKLEGLDSDWDLPSRSRSVVYTGLPPGRYRFLAVADNGEGDWSDDVAELGVAIRPYFWQTGWFPLLLAAGLLAAGYLVVRVRLAALRTRAAELEAEVQERTTALREQTDRLERSDRDKGDLLEQLRLQSERFERLSREDALTGLPNRRSLDEALQRMYDAAQRERRPLTVAVADIDHFKRINDTFSHPVGDEVIRFVAAQLRAGVRDADVVGRYGGEEFLMLFPGLTAMQAATVCERLRQSVTGSDLERRYQGLKVTLSIGLADQSERTGHVWLVSAADARLYAAKRGGRDQVRWEASSTSLE